MYTLSLHALTLNSYFLPLYFFMQYKMSAGFGLAGSKFLSNSSQSSVSVIECSGWQRRIRWTSEHNLRHVLSNNRETCSSFGGERTGEAVGEEVRRGGGEVGGEVVGGGGGGGGEEGGEEGGRGEVVEGGRGEAEGEFNLWSTLAVGSGHSCSDSSSDEDKLWPLSWTGGVSFPWVGAIGGSSSSGSNWMTWPGPSVET